LRYDFLAGGFYDENPFSGRFQDNQMLGLKLSYPLFLREERGKYELMQIKLQNMEWKLLQVNRDIELKLEAAFNECRNFSDQWIIRGEWAANVARLRDAEYTRFISGESSVFMVNIRDQSLWNARLSVIEYLTKYAKSKAYLQWSSGKMY
jgi:outer membrane protein TolC